MLEALQGLVNAGVTPGELRRDPCPPEELAHFAARLAEPLRDVTLAGCGPEILRTIVMGGGAKARAEAEPSPAPALVSA